MFDYTTIQKTFETQSKMFADIMQPKELKDIQEKSKEFALNFLDTTYQYAKEIIETGTIKGFITNGNKK
jgi:hypothetical protein